MQSRTVEQIKDIARKQVYQDVCTKCVEARSNKSLLTEDGCVFTDGRKCMVYKFVEYYVEGYMACMRDEK